MPRNGEARTAGKAAGGRTKTAEKDVDAQSNGHADSAQLIVDLDFIRGLIEAVDGSGIDYVEIVRSGTRVRVSKSPPAGPVMHAAPAAAMVTSAAAPAPVSAGATAAPAPAPVAAPEPPPSRLQDVKSPMVGTFYRAPAPEAPPYVENGTHVSKGQPLCILEAMKLMNELESEFDGIVREILSENGEPVEFGQVLFRIEPNAA